MLIRKMCARPSASVLANTDLLVVVDRRHRHTEKTVSPSNSFIAVTLTSSAGPCAGFSQRNQRTQTIQNIIGDIRCVTRADHVFSPYTTKPIRLR
ncbi:unnamed protein product, partial [Nesidiocoris tenuis]